MNNCNENISNWGPFTFALDSNRVKHMLEMKRKVFILSTSFSIKNVEKRLRTAIHLYQDIRRAGYSYLMFLQELDALPRICFAIPIDDEMHEQREMIQWIALSNPGSIYYEWYVGCDNNVFDESKICGYRIARNQHQKNSLQVFGELL